ncbi:MAG: NifU family protein [Alphaproteobacteria bacterium]|nr:NifU family protein [Alphaproteobacteria bacterium]NCB49749.1 NifU family protein [Alphaproteobacteria bacterium]
MTEKEQKTETEMSTEDLIKSLLEIRIRPVIQSHGGDISYKGFEDGIVYVELHGSCEGCPHQAETLSQNVQGFLTAVLPEVKEVKNILDK